MKRGFTQIELLIYCILFVLLLVALVGIFFTGTDFYRGAVGSYLISSDFETGVRVLRTELKETSFTAVRVYPNPQNAQARPGVSFPSARPADNQTSMLSPHGAPGWSKHVLYTLETGNGETANVVRWEKEYREPSFLPLASADLPQNISGNRTRVILRGILLPRRSYPSVKVDTDEHGGFAVRFLGYDAQRKEVLYDSPPGRIASGEATDVPQSGVARLVHVQLQGLSGSGSRGNYFSVYFRVSPRR